jgi:heme A synthase
MSTLFSRLALTGSLFLLTLGSGLWVSQSGKPYNTVIFTIHKLISLSTIIVTAITINYLHKLAALRPAVEYTAIAITALLFLFLLVSGGILSAAKHLPAFILRIHQAAPLLAFISTASTLYLLVSNR